MVVGEDTLTMRDDADAVEENRAVMGIVGGGKLAQYRPIGKKKNDRVFWVTAENATISWDKKPKR